MKKPLLEDVGAQENEAYNEITNGKGNKNLYTGNKSKELLVHIMQKGIEVDKPIKSKIFEQSVKWRSRQYPIVPERFVTDFKGVSHQYVDVNDVAVLTFRKDHEDNCRKCGGKMTVDSRESRALGRRGIFQAIWGLDNTHVILMIVCIIAAMAMAGAFFWAYMNATRAQAELAGAKVTISQKQYIIDRYYNTTGIEILR